MSSSTAALLVALMTTLLLTFGIVRYVWRRAAARRRAYADQETCERIWALTP
jgi:Flp pilus assembly protein TadB